MTKIKQIVMSTLVLFGSMVAPLLVGTVLVSAQNFPIGGGDDPISSGIDAGTCLSTSPESAEVANCPDETGAALSVAALVRLVINILSWIVGIAAIIMIIIGGFRYITSGGDSGNVSSAKNTILYAIIGLVVVALAQIIVRFVIGTTSGVFDTAG